MGKLSKCVYLAWEFGSAEAIDLKQDFLSEDELLIGICSLEKIVFLIGDNQVNYNKDYANLIKVENDEIAAFFQTSNIELSSIRRGLRELKGEGNNDCEDQMISRSDSCKDIFDEAIKIAENSNSDEIRCIHIIKAILNNPSDIIRQFFEDKDIELEELKTNLNIKNESKKFELSRNSVLMNNGKNLTELAKEGKLTQVIGRDEELLKVIRTLNKRKKNNPLIIGEPGVGKTALVNGLAVKIAEGNMKNFLKDKQIIEINMASLVAGTKYRGEFEEKITNLMKESKDNPEVILFVDEIHTLLGAGSASGSLDASNIIKPALVNGDIVMIGATTLTEYRKYFERDSALERRFQPIILEEPSPKDTLFILQGLKDNYEEYHNVKISDEALDAAVNLSERYINDRHLPDKALDLIDEACSRKIIPKLDITNSSNIESIVSEEDVKTVVSEWTGIPISNEISQLEKAQKIEDFLKSKIIGQDDAIEKVSKRIKNSYAGINNPDKPLAVFLFLGPTGVGKTYLSKILANYLFGSQKSLIRVDMSEYKEKHSVSRLIGAPPGYIGHDDGGFLTNAIRNNPFSIVLLDEIEKAHSKVLDVFLEVFDEGRLTDGRGNTVNAKNCIFIMTSNKEIENKTDYSVAYGGIPDEMNTFNILDNLTQFMRPEFVNRIDDVIIFNSLTKTDNESLVKLYVDDLEKRLLSEKSIQLDVEESVYEYIVNKGYNTVFGARYLKRTIEKYLEYPISEMIVNGEIISGNTIVVSTMHDNLKFNRG